MPAIITIEQHIKDADAYKKQQNFDQALVVYQKALAMVRDNLGENHLKTADLYANKTNDLSLFKWKS